MPAELRVAHEPLVAHAVDAKRAGTPLSQLDLAAVESRDEGAAARTPTEEAVLRMSLRLVYCCVDVQNDIALAGERADSPSKRPQGSPSTPGAGGGETGPPRPFIPGT